MTYGVSKSIFYFHNEGKSNLTKTVELVANRAEELDINNIIVFTADGEGAFALKEQTAKNEKIKIHAATFPYKQVFHLKDREGNPTEVSPKTSQKEVKEQLEAANINLIQGVMPLQDIIIPNTKDIKIQTINYTLSLLSGGLRLCIQAILMAADGGHIEPREQVIAMSADTAVVATSSLSHWMFHPTNGLEINEIICKPIRRTLNKG